MRKHRATAVLRDLEMRSIGDHHSLTGYVAVFDSDSRPIGGGKYIESIAPGAFKRSLSSPPNGRQTLVIDHDDSRIIGATNGTPPTEFREDSVGLFVDAPRLPDTQDVRDLRELGDAGLLAGMSFEFLPTANGVQTSDGGRRRRATELRLFHGTVLTGKTPAYGATTVEVRALAASAGVDADLLDVALDAVREGRELEADEWATIERTVVAIAPRESRWSKAAADASAASYTLAGILSALACEEPSDGDLAQLLKDATASVSAYIAAKAAAVGSPEDQAASKPEGDSGDMPYRSLPYLEAARALIARF